MSKFKGFIPEALMQAEKARDLGEIPVGAVVVDPGKKQIVSFAYNQVITSSNVTAHAEILAITKATEKLQVSRLDGYDLYTSLEPCAMCAAAISLSRIRRLYFAVEEPKFGAVISNLRYFDSSCCHHKVEYYYGYEELKATKLLKDFFKKKR